jgi:hypothetical protein
MSDLDVSKLSAAELKKLWRDQRRRRQWARQVLEARIEARRQKRERFEQEVAEVLAKASVLPDDQVWFRDTSRRNAKVVEALEDAEFLYREQKRVFRHRHRRGEAREGQASVFGIVAELHQLPVNKLTNLKKNQRRSRMPKKT